MTSCYQAPSGWPLTRKPPVNFWCLFLCTTIAVQEEQLGRLVLIHEGYLWGILGIQSNSWLDTGKTVILAAIINPKASKEPQHQAWLPMDSIEGLLELLSSSAFMAPVTSAFLAGLTFSSVAGGNGIQIPKFREEKLGDIILWKNGTQLFV